MTLARKLSGTWVKVTSGNDGEYPDQITFDGDHGYSAGNLTERGTHPLWDTGTYQFQDDEHVVMSTFNDANIEYGIKLSNNEFVVTDPSGSKVKYKRSN